MIDHKMNIPHVFKFKLPGIFNAYIRRHQSKVIRAIGHDIHIAWSFDLGNTFDLRGFKNQLRIFQPVDEPLSKIAIRAAKGAEVMFSVTKEILEKYRAYQIPKHFINHGVANVFLDAPKSNQNGTDGLRIGYSGNMLRRDIDRETFLQLVRSHQKVIFECWGTYESKDSNLGASDDDQTLAFIKEMLVCDNVILHGPVPIAELAKELNRMDAFLICYDIQKDQSKGTNYHKVLEYLSTGKVVISNNISTYSNMPKLVQMCSSRKSNAELPSLFDTVVNQLENYNDEDSRRERIAFAQNHSYSSRIEVIDQRLSEQTALSKKAVATV